MPVETASYISQLVPANPASDDALATTQNHLQLIKTVLQTQFPNLGAAAVAAAAADLYAGIGSDVTSLKTNAVVKNLTGSSQQAIVGSLNVQGTVNAGAISQGGFQLLPRSSVIMWYGQPNTVPSGWHLCDGTNGTPDLRDRFVIGAGSSYAAGATGGASSQTVSTSSAGAHSHGGGTTSSGPWNMSGSSDVQGLHSHGGSTAGYQLQVGDIPSHTHGYGVTAVGLSGGGSLIGTLGSSTTQQTQATGGNGFHAHGIFQDGAHAHNISVSQVPAHNHGITSDGTHAHTVSVSTLPPFAALCYIMKL